MLVPAGVFLTDEQCYLLREGVRREVARVRALGAHRTTTPFDQASAEVEASAAAFESSASGHSAYRFASTSRSGVAASGHGRAESLAQQEESRNVSAARAAELLGVSVRTVRRLAATGGLQTARKVGRDWVIDLAEVIAMKGQP